MAIAWACRGALGEADELAGAPLCVPATKIIRRRPGLPRRGVLEPRMWMSRRSSHSAEYHGGNHVSPGPFFAAPTAFRITIEGRGGHAAAPHQSIDAVVVAAHVITALQTVVSRSMAPTDTAVLTVGKIAGGFRGNVIAESATMTGTIRSYTDAVREGMLRRTEDIVAGVCAAFGATYEFTHHTSSPPLVNDPGIAAYVRARAEEFFGPANILAAPSMGAEDMGVFLEARPGCYFWLGARNEAKGIAGRHHDPAFVIDADALLVGVEFGMRLIEGQLAL